MYAESSELIVHLAQLINHSFPYDKTELTGPSAQCPSLHLRASYRPCGSFSASSYSKTFFYSTTTKPSYLIYISNPSPDANNKS